MPELDPVPEPDPEPEPERIVEPVLTVMESRPLRPLVMLDPIRMIDGRLHLLLGDGVVCPVRYGDPAGLHPGWRATALYVGCDHLLWLALLHVEGHQADWFLTEQATYLADRVEDIPGPFLDGLVQHVRVLLQMPPGPTRDAALDALGHMHLRTREAIDAQIAARDGSSRPSEIDHGVVPSTMPAQPGKLTAVVRLVGADLARPGVLGGVWRQDGDRIVVEAGQPLSVTLRLPYRPLHARFSVDLSGVHPTRKLTVTADGWTIGTTRVGHEKAGGSRLDYWIPAEALDGDTVRIELVTPPESIPATAFTIDRVAFDVGPATPATTPRADDTALMTMFESLGENCEFGFVQRYFGAEPLGLFRFAGTTDIRNTLRLLESDFEGLGDTGSLSTISTNAVLYRLPDPPLIIPEFMMVDEKRRFWYHTFHGPEQHTEAEACALNEQKLRYLTRKFIEDLEDGEKIWVLKDSVRGDLNEAFAFLDVLNRRGPNRLFWVTRLVEGRPPGAVEWVAPNLLRGYSGGEHRDPQIFDAEAWKVLCLKAARAFAERDARGH
ncbi:hypothetical protein [Lichenicola sp.]|uniref:hypothetical protein n=1 Tax=Lichenicola sp. TaxID=2804529 RepID=UPI003AFFD2DD